MIISVDPGKLGAGVAVFEDRELTWAAFVEGKDWFDTAANVSTALHEIYDRTIIADALLVIEVMQIYKPKHSKGDPNKSLVPLLQMASALSGILFLKPEEFRPRQWKGQQPKSVTIHLVKESLSEEEIDRIEMPKKSLQHNVYDAIGIGIHYMRGVRSAYKSHQKDRHLPGNSGRGRKQRRH